jgi:hypothetical protein
MTLEELEKKPREILTCADIAGIFEVDADDIRKKIWKDQKTGKNSFDFPIVIIQYRIKIPKAPFIKFMRGESQALNN